jgi:glycosyltransferase involved in cell wall biosynthesis
MLIDVKRIPMPAESMDLSRVAAIFPAYNEERHIADSIAAALSVGVGAVVAVNDRSKDGTGAVIDALADGKRVFALHHAENAGKEGAVLTGLRFALGLEGFEAFAFLDSDMQVDPAILPHLCSAIRKKDFVMGARERNPEMPFERKLANTLANLPYRMFARIPVTDVQSGLRVYSRRLAGILVSRLDGKARYALEHTSLFAIASWAIETRTRLRAMEVDIVCRYGDAASHIRAMDNIQLVLCTLYFSAIAIPLKRLLRFLHAKIR